LLVGNGLDMVDLDRIEKMLKKNERWIIEKVLSKRERAYYLDLNGRENKLAWVGKCFAIKEATFKAINQLIYGKFNFLNIEFIVDENGKPNIYSTKIDFKEKGIFLHHSISLTSKTVTAFVTAEKLKEVSTNEN